MTWAELERKIKKAGWRFDHHGGKHDVYSHPEKNIHLQILRHKTQEVASGTLRQILRDAGLK